MSSQEENHSARYTDYFFKCLLAIIEISKIVIFFLMKSAFMWLESPNITSLLLCWAMDSLLLLDTLLPYFHSCTSIAYGVLTNQGSSSDDLSKPTHLPKWHEQLGLHVYVHAGRWESTICWMRNSDLSVGILLNTAIVLALPQYYSFIPQPPPHIERWRALQTSCVNLHDGRVTFIFFNGYCWIFWRFLLNKFMQKTMFVSAANYMRCSSIWFWCKEGVVTMWHLKKNIEHDHERQQQWFWQS